MKKFASLLLILSCYLSVAQKVDHQGRKQGYWKKKDDRNHLIYEGEFKDNVPVGKFIYYHPNDSVRAIMYFRNGGKSAYAKLFYMHGKRMAEGKYINKEVKDSIWTYYDELGVLISKETYNAGKKQGISYVYMPDGSLSEERTFSNDQPNGPFKQYFDGKVVRSQGRYLNGALDGRVAYYFPNGIEAAAGFYKNGKKNGPWIYKDKDGKVQSRELYKDGVQASQKDADAFFAKNKTVDTPAPKTKPATKPKSSGK